ncbi:MAG: ATP/GTP-binding protein [Bacteroidota bacterium]
MKKLLLLLIIIGPNLYAQHSLEKVWSTDSTSLKNPESVLYDSKAKILFVSNIGEFGKDGVGFVSKVGLDGKIIKKDWVTGLTSTKGLGMNKNTLYAAENTAVAVIDIAKGTITKRITIDGAEMLNDITVDSKGIVYVSDSKKGKIHKIENDKPSVYLENVNGINGLLSVGTDLYILADGKFWKADSSKKLTQLVEGIEGGADGIEMIGKGEFLLTGWGGTIYYAKEDGTKQVLSDTRDKKVNAADLGWDGASKTAYIPQMTSNRVVAFKLK